jgi:hypothetical protein
MTDDKDRGYRTAYEGSKEGALPPWDEFPLPWREMIVHIWFEARKSAESK